MGLSRQESFYMGLESVHLSLLGTAPTGQLAPASASSSLRGRPEQSALQNNEPEIPSKQIATKQDPHLQEKFKNFTRP